VTFVDPLLTNYFGFNSPPNLGSGVIAQLDLVGTGTLPGSFTGIQSSANIAAAVPQPVPLMLLGTGLIGIAFLVRQRESATRRRRAALGRAE
jgi:hypothetical protein